LTSARKCTDTAVEVPPLGLDHPELVVAVCQHVVGDVLALPHARDLSAGRVADAGAAQGEARRMLEAFENAANESC
jgi:hypothetical protein